MADEQIEHRLAKQEQRRGGVIVPASMLWQSEFAPKRRAIATTPSKKFSLSFSAGRPRPGGG